LTQSPIVANTDVFVRAAPQLDAPIVGSVPRGQTVFLLSADSGWVEIEWRYGSLGNQRGWLESGYLDLPAELDTLPIQTPTP
jgi:uncharacterized protein YraI